jgi:hypothetical protein
MLYRKAPRFVARPALTNANIEGFEKTNEHSILKIQRVDPCQPCPEATHRRIVEEHEPR